MSEQSEQTTEHAPGNGHGAPPTEAEGSIVAALPGLARIAGAAAWRTTGWTVNAYVRVGSRVMRAAVSGESPADLFQEAGAEAREYLRRLLEIVDAGNGSQSANGRPARSTPNGRPESLRDRGAELLRRSADVHESEDPHPAYERILDELAPDEGRILRLLALEGPQPAVDVRTARPFGVGSELVALGLTMIGAEAGVRRTDSVHRYLNNLNRLGLIWFSREPVDDRLRYQVLEAQPEVAEAMREAGRGRTVRRSIHLTPFGHDFCDTCLPLHTAELDALPGDAAGAEGNGAPRPDAPA